MSRDLEIICVDSMCRAGFEGWSMDVWGDSDGSGSWGSASVLNL